MNNFNLKYLIIGAISLSVLVIGGAFVFTLLNKPKSTSPKPAIPVQSILHPGAETGEGGGGIER